MKLVFANIKGYYKEVILGPLFKLVEAILELLVPVVMAGIIDRGIAQGDKAYIWRGGAMLALLGALGFGAAMVCQYYAAVAAGHFGRNLRGQLYKHVLSLSPADTAPYGSGGLITRLTNDVNQVQNGLNMTIRLGARGPFLLVGSIVMALWVNWKIGLIFLISTPVVIAVIYLLMRSTLPGYAKIQQGQDNLSRLGAENLEGVRVIRAFSRQEEEKNQFARASQALTNILVRVGEISASLNPLTNTLIYLAVLAIIWLGATFANNGLLASGEIIALVTYMTQSLLALTVAANLTVLFTRAIASAHRVEEVLQLNPTIADGPGAVESENAPAVVFRQVSFAYYEGAENALANVSFTLPRGATLGIIGGTGSGKSTIANLVCRFYDAGGGSIRVCGADIRDYPLACLRQKIGLVPQKAALLSGSIRHNMNLGGLNATDEEIWQALETSQVADFVRQKDEGLDFCIEEGGKNLSGGQRQRLTIARALVRKPAILILDDASSALDYATDAALRRALSGLAQKGMSVMLISQRAASIRHADNILVLDDGAPAANGTHEELLIKSPLYREICASQGLIEGGSHE